MKRKGILIPVAAVIVIGAIAAFLFLGRGRDTDKTPDGTEKEQSEVTVQEIVDSGEETFDETDEVKGEEQGKSLLEALSEDGVMPGIDLSAVAKEPVWTFDTSQDGRWQGKRPYINPMGDQDAYYDTYNEKDSYQWFSYVSNEQTVVERYIYGNYFQLTIPFDENKTEEENWQFLLDIETYAEAVGGEVKGTEMDQTVFMALDSNGDRWWASARVEYDSIVMDVVQERELRLGETLVIDTGRMPNPYYFASYHDGEGFQVLNVISDGGYANVDIRTVTRYGDYERDMSIGIGLDETVGDNYIVADMPNEPGVSLYEVYWDSYEAPRRIELTLDEVLDMPSPKYGEALGAIKVSAAYLSDVRVSPTNGSHYYLGHPEYMEDYTFMDMTPDGDYMVYVPAGFWNVQLSPEDGSVMTYYESLGVPVSSGQVTELRIPYSMAASFSEKDGGYNPRGVEIGKVTEDTDAGNVGFYFTLLDKETKEIPPDKNNTTVYENGQPVVIKEINHVKEPPKVVLLLDSSGSMKGELSGVLDAAETFIEGLPDDSSVQVVDFDSTVKVLDGTSKAEAMANLSRLSVGGDTALYQSLVQSTQLLSGESRPMVVLFTDGENDLGGQSQYTKEETFQIMEDSGLPVLTIGFGAGHDGQTLNALAQATNGRYFDAKDTKALEGVFDAINERIGNTYKAVYERPKVSGVADIPVITLMVDTSGSMEEIDEGNGQRIHNVQNLLYPFIMDLPEDTLVQLMGFNSNPYAIQGMTADKRRLVLGLEHMEVGGNTEIPAALHGGLLSLKHVPSAKKIMIFMTDEALEPEDDTFIEFTKELNKEGIQVLWVGLGLEEVEEAFAAAAALTNSDYVVTSDVEVLREAFDTVLNQVVEMPDRGISQVSIEIEKENEMGAREEYGTMALVKLSETNVTDDEMVIELIQEAEAGVVDQYDAHMASLVTGQYTSDTETFITSRAEVNKQVSGEAVTMDVMELVYMDQLYGVKAPSGYRYVGLNMGIENIMAPMEVTVYPDGSNHPSAFVAGGSSGETVMMVPDYLIPDYKSHFFLTVNNDASHPASDATWLTNEPLAVPGNSGIQLAEAVRREGMLVFLIPDEPVSQMSLHLFDSAYGDVHMPVIGEMKPQASSLIPMPETAGTALSDMFSLNILDVRDGSVDFDLEQDEDVVFREIEGLITSNVNALLDLTPSKRMHMTIATGDGDYWFDIHEGTSLLPYGHYQQRMLSPGSNNRSVWVYELPKVFENNEAGLHIDLSGGDVSMPVVDGKKVAAGTEVIYEASGEGYKLRLHSAVQIEESVGALYGGAIVLDVTIEDLEDGYSTYGVDELFRFTAVTEDGSESEAYLDYINDELLLCMTEDSIVYDGTSRRGFLVYQPNTWEEVSWTLTSPVHEDLTMTIEKGGVDEPYFSKKTEFYSDETFMEELSWAVSERIEQYEKTQPLAYEGITEGLVGGSYPDLTEVAVPMSSVYGAKLSEEVDSLEKALLLLRSLRYVPTNRYLNPFEYRYSMEAVLTQEFGSEGDIANAAMQLLSGLGYRTSTAVVDLSDEGRQLLESVSGVPTFLETLPAVAYEDEQGSHLLVLPFAYDISELPGICYYSRDQYVTHQSLEAAVTVSLEVESLKPGHGEQLSDISDALAGDTEGLELLIEEEMMYLYMPMSDLSNDAIDIGFVKEGNQMRVYMLTQEGLRWSERTLDLGEYKPRGIVVEVDYFGDPLRHRTAIEEDRTAEHHFLTVGLNLPAMTERSATLFDETAKEAHEGVENPGDLSALRWYSREIINRFVVAQTEYEDQLSKELSLVTGRTDTIRMMVVSMKAPAVDESGTATLPFESSVDLVYVFNDIHAGDGEAMNSFNIMSGMFMTALEAEVLGDFSLGVLDIMAQVPDGTDLVLLKPWLEGEDQEALLEAGLSPNIISRLSETENYIIMPNKPAMINGSERWAWFEIDPNSYQTIGVLDTFERGAIVSNLIIDTAKGAGQYLVGAYLGINTSIWSVAAVSLQESDYQEILKQAKAFAMGMKDGFGVQSGKFSAPVGGMPEVSQKFGPMKVAFDGKGKITQDFLGFTQGYEAGVAYYFEKAK